MLAAISRYGDLGGSVPGVLNLVALYREYLTWWQPCTGNIEPGGSDILILVIVYHKYSSWWQCTRGTDSNGSSPQVVIPVAVHHSY